MFDECWADDLGCFNVTFFDLWAGRHPPLTLLRNVCEMLLGAFCRLANWFPFVCIRSGAEAEMEGLGGWGEGKKKEAVAFGQNQKLICDSASCQERAVWICDCG